MPPESTAGKRPNMRTYGVALSSERYQVLRTAFSRSRPEDPCNGSGRSGTHWVGGTLSSSPQIRVLSVEPPVFNWITRKAQEPGFTDNLFPKLIAIYKSYHAAVAQRYLADKSHCCYRQRLRICRRLSGGLNLPTNRKITFRWWQSVSDYLAQSLTTSLFIFCR